MNKKSRQLAMTLKCAGRPFPRGYQRVYATTYIWSASDVIVAQNDLDIDQAEEFSGSESDSADDPPPLLSDGQESDTDTATARGRWARVRVKRERDRDGPVLRHIKRERMTWDPAAAAATAATTTTIAAAAAAATTTTTTTTTTVLVLDRDAVVQDESDDGDDNARNGPARRSARLMAIRRMNVVQMGR